LRRRTPAAKVRPTDARGRPAEPAPPEPLVEAEETIAEPSAGYRVVALDGMGVLYREGNDVRELLVPFARERGSTVPDDEILVKARQLSLGRMTPADFWAVIGVEGDPNELDSAYLALHQLMPGVVKYLRSLRDSGVKAACITNDAAAWAMKLRAGHSLEGLVDPWVISGSVGVRKPDPPLFEVLRRVTGEPPSSILVIDDDLDNLDAAGRLGFGTAWFTADGERTEARGHALFRSFDAVNAVNGVDTIDIPIDEENGATTSD
ncbi:MAG: HAD family hydrolase, partial [Acidimicrobiales bacterium]